MAVTRNKPDITDANTSSAFLAKQEQRGGHPAFTIFTVGHSTRAIDEFIALLHAHGVRQLIDVRTIPRSRHNPQFGQEQLGPVLEDANIRYRHMPALGGLRRACRDSVNTAWRNASFRGYAGYMQTQSFADALNELIVLGRERRTVIMCAEAVPWRCHRSLIADALLVRGINAEEIVGPTRARQHKLTPWARVDGMTITYPAAETTSVEKDSGCSRRVRDAQNG